MTNTKAPHVGRRIRRFREERGMSLSQLAQEAGLAKSYLWSLENESSAARPSGEKLYEIARVLGVTMSDLLGREVLLKERDIKVPAALREFADEEGLPEADVRALAAIRFRGEQPKTKERWRFIYDAIRVSEGIDRERR